MIVPIVIGLGGYALYRYFTGKSTTAAYAAPSAPLTDATTPGFAATPVVAPPGAAFASPSADAAPSAVYTLADKDQMQMVGRRFTFNRAEFDKANPGFLAAYNISPTSSGLMFHFLQGGSAQLFGKTINLPPDSRDNGPREMAMGTINGFVPAGITKDAVPNPPGVSDVQGALIRETLAASQKAGTAASATSGQIANWLKVIKR